LGYAANRFRVEIRVADWYGWFDDWPVSPTVAVLEFDDVTPEQLRQLAAVVTEIDYLADVEVEIHSDRGRCTPVFRGNMTDCLKAVLAS
jgi:hypothetical protein